MFVQVPCSRQGFVEVNLPSSPQSDQRPLRVLWAVKGQEFWFELTESNFEYLVHLFRNSEVEEKCKKAKAKVSPSRRRRLRRRLSEEDQQPEQQNED